MRRCAVELTGRNSVSPSTIPRKIDKKNSYMGSIVNGVSASLSQRLHPAFIRSDTHRLFHLRNEDLSIPDLPRLRRAQDRFDGALRSIVWNDHLEFYFRQEIDRVLGAAINFAVTFLAAKAFYFAESHSFHARCHERFFDRLSFKRLDDRLDFFHRAKLAARSKT